MRRREFLASTAGAGLARGATRSPNVLLITIDDLRPQLGCYGDRYARTPNIDRLAARGTVFERAYCQQALCGPSRSSFLTGLRPETLGIYDIETHFRSKVPDVVTLPQYFKNHGYYTRGFQKVFHLAGFDPEIGNLNDPPSWSEELYLPRKPHYGPEGQRVLDEAYARIRAAGGKPGYTNLPRSFAVEAPEVGDEDLADGDVAREALATLRRVKDRPFFLAVGFYKPHLPFVAPKRYWDLYDERALELPRNQHPPDGTPEWVVPGWNELGSYVGMPKHGPMPPELGRRLLHGYLASISYVDALVGGLLGELDRLGLRGNTVVTLLGDNGFQLGEHGAWANKHSNFETSARVPLIVSAPGQRRAGARSKALVELVDLYQTLAVCCGLPAPESLEGSSLRPLLDEPARPWKRAAFSLHPRGKRMGRSARTERYRYTEWALPGQRPDTFEFYDHSTDPGENVNLAAASGYRKTLDQMRAVLHAGWRAAMPPQGRA